MERIQNYYESSPIGKAVVLSCLIIPFVAFAFFVFSKKNEANKETNVIDESHLTIYEKDTTFNTKKDGYYKKNTSRQKIESSDDFFDFSTDVRKVKEGISDLESIENDEFIEQLQKDMEKDEANQLAAQRSFVHKSKKEDKLSYQEALAKAREEYFETGKNEEEREKEGKKELSEKVVFRASVFRTQYLVPGERVDLMTSQEFIYNNMRFKKGMRFYATIDIQETRVLFDIDNIAHIPLKVEARDITDGRIGLYSKRAAELWSIYQEKLKEEAKNDATGEIANTVNIPVISSSIQILSNFFTTKKGRKSKKLKIDNNSQLIITIL